MSNDKTLGDAVRYEWLGASEQWSACDHSEAKKLSAAGYEVREVRSFRMDCTCPSGDGSLRHPCPAHPATLATAKHGGCVQLPTSERERFEAWAEGNNYEMEWTGLRYVEEATQDAWLAWQAALAARQPVWEPVTPWRDHSAAVDSKALATATEIALMWGQDRSQFVSRIQVAVIDAMQWMRGGLSEQTAQAVDLGARPIETAPRDGTMVRLLVQFEENATEDTAEPAWTIGACNDDNVGDEERIGWQFAGWCWTHDHFTEGKGTPVGWLPLIDSQAVGDK